MKLTGGENRSTVGKSCPIATLCTTNPTWTDLDLRGERRETNRLSHGTSSENDIREINVIVIFVDCDLFSSYRKIENAFCRISDHFVTPLLQHNFR
jgi:hypothetical protein